LISIEHSVQQTDRPNLADAYLRRNASHYEALLDLSRARSLPPDAALLYLQAVADFAQFHHPGRFADGALENVAIDFGRSLAPSRHRARAPWDDQTFARRAGRRVLHVATAVCAVGGHTRTIKNWTINDPDSCHWLVVTSQGHEPVPQWLNQAVEGSGGRIIVFPDRTSILARAAWLRDLARRDFDLVVLHHFGHDAVPTVAFAADNLPPVATLNHADHLFWLGGGVADLTIQLRRVSRILNDRRFVRADVGLPIPLCQGKQQSVSQEEARRAVGIPADQMVLLTVGRACKYLPSGEHDFFATAAQILRKHQSAHLYVIGVGPHDGVRPPDPDVAARLHLAGEVEDPWLYQRAADLYLEAFPFGSQTATLEAGFAALAPVLAWRPPCPLLVTSDDALDGVATNPASQEHYLAEVSALISDNDRRRETGRRFQTRVLSCHVGEQWAGRARGLYEAASQIRHSPRRLEVTTCEASPLDIALSQWQATSKRDTQTSVCLSRRRQVIAECAYAARESGDYRGALSLLKEGGARWGCDRRVLSALAKLVPHGVVSMFRNRVERVPAF
jgi:hypothetical protein